MTIQTKELADGRCTVGLKVDGTMVAVGYNEDGQCNVSGWRDIGPVSEEQVLKWKQAKSEAEERRRVAEQQQHWQAQGLCKYCGGKLGGLFTKKCKACGREQ